MQQGDIILTGMLKTDSRPFEVRIATPDDIPEICNLVDEIISSMDEVNHKFIIAHDADWFKKHIETPGNATMVLTIDNTIVGRGDVYASPLASWNDSGFDHNHLDYIGLNKVAVLSGARVLPSLYRNDLHRKITEARAAFAQAQERTHLATLIDCDNFRSFGSLLGAGFTIEATGEDLSDGCLCHTVVGEINRIIAFNRAAMDDVPRPNEQTAHYTNLKRIKVLLNTGFRGVAWKRDTQEIAFIPATQSLG